MTERLPNPCLEEQFTEFKRSKYGRKARLVRQGTMEYHWVTHLSLFAWPLDTSMILNKEGVFLSIEEKYCLNSHSRMEFRLIRGCESCKQSSVEIGFPSLVALIWILYV